MDPSRRRDAAAVSRLSAVTSDPSASPRAATIYDVARRAQVSHETVSRVLRGNPAVKEKNRERVQRALSELNYRPNTTARALATSRSRRIGAMVYDLIESGPSQFVEGATEAARAAGYLLDIVSINTRDDRSVMSAIDLLNQPDLAGLIAVTPTDHAREAVASTNFRIPVFQESEAEDAPHATSVSLNTIGTELAVRHLLDLGHRRIVHIAGPAGWVSARNRAHAYERTMRSADLEPEIIESSDWSAASGHALASVMPLRGVTAILAANDQIAIGTLLALHDRGIGVPDDISVAGFDDIPESKFVIPPLTTVRLQFEQAGRRAVLCLLAEIEGTEVPAEASRGSVLAELVVRRSTAKANAAR